MSNFEHKEMMMDAMDCHYGINSEVAKEFREMCNNKKANMTSLVEIFNILMR